ncbi:MULTISPECIES: hypothetical protein [Vibrio]|jgi:hypothetical protein|nr:MULTISPECIES: hypothetical protein [Vibrio]MCC4852520.1 hypothetical protein [Vibrio lentus]OEF17832.1 hypothetical protein A145_17740 [Vibrio splendidus 5S-101]
MKIFRSFDTLNTSVVGWYIRAMNKIIISTLGLMLLSGCAVTPSFYAHVDAISAPESLNKKSYILLPGNEGVSQDDLLYMEYSNYLVRALSESGFEKASDFPSADIAIFMAYGIGDPRNEQYTYSIPTWGQTGVSSANTFGTVNTYGNTSTYSATTTLTPTYGVTGSTTHIGNTTTYDRFLNIVAYDVDVYKKTEKMKQVWTTTVISSGSSGDLRRVMPVLVSAANPYLGKNTGQQVPVTLNENDKVVKNIKGIAGTN